MSHTKNEQLREIRKKMVDAFRRDDSRKIMMYRDVYTSLAGERKWQSAWFRAFIKAHPNPPKPKKLSRRQEKTQKALSEYYTENPRISELTDEGIASGDDSFETHEGGKKKVYINVDGVFWDADEYKKYMERKASDRAKLKRLS